MAPRRGKYATDFGDGWSAGWREYRHGSKQSRPITLAGRRKQEAVLRGERRKHVVQEVMGVLRDWRDSSFEFEAACRHGLRAALCMEGLRWKTSDEEAASIVAEGRYLLGARRPTWDQGQREYVISEDNCAGCGGLLPAAANLGTRRYRYCSPECARMAIRSRDNKHIAEVKRSLASAWAILRREDAPPRTCVQCRGEFRPLDRESWRQKYCSTVCRDTARRKKPILCAGCGTPFRRRPGQRFCSPECFRRSRQQASLQVARLCAHCGTPFFARDEKAKFCRPNCRSMDYAIRAGLRPPRPPWPLTPQRLDWLFMAASLRITAEVTIAA